MRSILKVFFSRLAISLSSFLPLYPRLSLRAVADQIGSFKNIACFTNSFLKGDEI